MSWCITTRDIPSAHTYEVALRVFDESVPFNKDEPLERALSTKRMKHKVVRMLRGTEAVAFRLYQTDLVTYWPDGTTKMCSHDTVSSREFLYRVVPANVAVRSITSSTWFEIDGKYYRGDITVSPTGEITGADKPGWEAVGDRKKMAAARARIKDFTHWLEVTREVTQRKQVTSRSPSYHSAEDYVHQLLSGNEAAWPAIANGISSANQLYEALYWATGAYTARRMEVGQPPNPRALYVPHRYRYE